MKQIAYYLRTSHYLQNIGTQVDKIEDGWKIYKDEGVSGRVAFADRPMAKKLLKDIREGIIDQIVVLRLDRLGRDTSDILGTIKMAHLHGVGIVSKNEGITTMVNGKENPMSNLLISILSSIAEFEYHRIKEKTLEGIARGKRLGVYKGRKQGSIEPYESFIKKPKVKKVRLMLKEGLSVRKICELLECSPNFITKVKERLVA
ncbi:MAG: recombinase family protein [Cyclobacteriaceae bacterium]|nr:recombinase family protein [Cyclobacteriaceae bacterium]